MLKINAFKYCPKCKNLLKKNKQFLQCLVCETNYYFNPSPTCAAIILNEKKEILLTKRKYSPKKNWWDLPGGFAEPKESMEECLKRELYEELDIKINDYQYFGSFWGTYTFQKITYYTLSFIYLIKLKQQVIKAKDDVSAYAFFAPKNINLKTISFKDIKKALKLYLSSLNK